MKQLLYYPLCAVLCVSLASAALPIKVIAEEIQPQETAAEQAQTGATNSDANKVENTSNPNTAELDDATTSTGTSQVDPAVAADTPTPTLRALTNGTPDAISTAAETGYTHSATAMDGDVTFTVSWNDAPAGTATTFHVTQTNGSSQAKARMDAPTYWDNGTREDVCDASRKAWDNYYALGTTGYDFTFDFTASGTYKTYFYFMDLTNNIGYLRTQVVITADDAARPSVTQIVNNAVAQCKKETSGSEYEMALWLHDWTLSQLEYDHSYNYCSAESGLTRHVGTCESYQRIYSKLLNAAGIANGRIEGNGHTWNAVKIDGKWCQMDLTWDDSNSTYGDMEQKHLYFGLTDELMAIAHSDHKTNYQKDDYAYRSTDLSNNYFVRNGKADEWAGKYADRIQEHLNAKETNFSINADNQLDPPSISGIQNGIVAYAMNQRSWTANNNKIYLNAVSNVTMTSSSTWTTKYDFTAEYTNQQAAATEKLDVSQFKHGPSTSAWTAPSKGGYAFAGWYSDEGCTKVYTGTSGQAYARFVPVSEIIGFQGCSLRNDGQGSDVASLRFSYEFTLPSDATLKKMGWNWSKSETGTSGYLPATSYWLAGGGTAKTNAVFAEIQRSGAGGTAFSSPCALAGKISYVTADGTTVEVAEPERRSATVSDVAAAIAAGGMGSSADKEYAKQILGGQVPSSQPVSGVTSGIIEKLNVSNYKAGTDSSAWTAPSKGGYAFAGWYSDEGCTKVYTGTSGQAYARFVPVSEIIGFQGCSLRNDGQGSDVASLRFSYEFTLPSDATLKKMGWNWSKSETGTSGYLPATSYWLAGGGTAKTNAVFAEIQRSGAGGTAFSSPCALAGKISYVTADGTTVEVAEPERRSATVSDVAAAIAAGGMGSSADKAYANAILKS